MARSPHCLPHLNTLDVSILVLAQHTAHQNDLSAGSCTYSLCWAVVFQLANGHIAQESTVLTLKESNCFSSALESLYKVETAYCTACSWYRP